jgi:glycolate oxidase FAD binding subunit
VRDFILGVRYVDGSGQVVRAGGKVVKNAAGFDIPKLMVGSLGQLGVLVELTFKVFPKPEAYATLRAEYASLDEAMSALYRLTGSQMDLYALDLEPASKGARLLVRLGGLVAALPDRLERLAGLTGGGEILVERDDAAAWRDATEFAWVPEGCSLVKVPVTPGRIPELEADLTGFENLSGLCRRRYSAGGQVCWIAAPGPLEALDGSLSTLGLSGLVVLAPPGATGPVRLGVRAGEPFERRVRQALDPQGRFVAR